MKAARCESALHRGPPVDREFTHAVGCGALAGELLESCSEGFERVARAANFVGFAAASEFSPAPGKERLDLVWPKSLPNPPQPGLSVGRGEPVDRVVSEQTLDLVGEFGRHAKHAQGFLGRGTREPGGPAHARPRLERSHGLRCVSCDAWKQRITDADAVQELQAAGGAAGQHDSLDLATGGRAQWKTRQAGWQGHTGGIDHPRARLELVFGE